MYIPQDPPLVLHMLNSWQPTCNSRCGTWLRFELTITHTEDERATIFYK